MQNRLRRLDGIRADEADVRELLHARAAVAEMSDEDWTALSLLRHRVRPELDAPETRGEVIDEEWTKLDELERKHTSTGNG